MFRRDLIGAWHRPQQAVSAGRPLNRSGGGRGHDRARCGHPQALAHDRRRDCGDGRATRREDRLGRRSRLRGAAGLGARTAGRAGVGTGGLPARVWLVRAVLDRARGACRSRRDQTDGRRTARRASARQVRHNTLQGTCTISGPSSRSRAARCSRGSGRRGSAGAWRAPSRPHGSGSRATSCATCASSHTPSKRSRPRSPNSSPRPCRCCPR